MPRPWVPSQCLRAQQDAGAAFEGAWFHPCRGQDSLPSPPKTQGSWVWTHPGAPTLRWSEAQLLRTPAQMGHAEAALPASVPQGYLPGPTVTPRLPLYQHLPSWGTVWSGARTPHCGLLHPCLGKLCRVPLWLLPSFLAGVGPWADRHMQATLSSRVSRSGPGTLGSSTEQGLMQPPWVRPGRFHLCPQTQPRWVRPDHLCPSAQVAAIVAGDGPVGAAPMGPWQQHSGGTQACGVGTSDWELPGRGALGQPDQIVSPTHSRGACPQPVPTPRGSAKLCVSDWTSL